jgi:type IV pilus assembly protein PilF
MRNTGFVILCALLGALVCITGCTTTVVGDLGPQPGTTEERVEAHLALARGYLEKRDLERARGPLESALEIDPRSPDAHVLLAIIYQAQGEDAHMVERQYKVALRYAPDSSQALNNYGTFLFAQGRYEDARTELKKAVADPNYAGRAHAYENLGLCQLRLGETDAAELSFQRSLRLSSAAIRANLELAHIYFDAGDNPAAARYYAAFSESTQQTARSLWLGVRLARTLDDQDTAASYGLALRNLYPGSEEYQLYRESLR